MEQGWHDMLSASKVVHADGTTVVVNRFFEDGDLVSVQQDR